jgi:hypothetical protein
VQNVISTEAPDAQMLAKGNVLQYKKNSSNLTKKQRYAQIAKGQWTNRTKSFATQSQKYTNPNISSLQRVNYVNVPQTNNIPNPFGCNTTFIQDGGKLIGNTYVDPCTQEVVLKTYGKPCNLTTSSDVPGKPQILCWDDGGPTWYPRQRYTMSTSGTKWPEGYKGLDSAIQLEAPVLSISTQINCNIFLSWTITNYNCIPISNYLIYENDIVIANVLYDVNSYIVANPDVGEKIYKIKAFSRNVESEFSNIVSVTIPPVDIPMLQIAMSSYPPVTLNWSINVTTCHDITGFIIYQNNILIAQVPDNQTAYTISSGLIPNAEYIYRVQAVSYGNLSDKSNSQTILTDQLEPPVLELITLFTCPSIKLNWTTTDNRYKIDYYEVYQNDKFLRNTSLQSTTIPVDGLTPEKTYYFSVKAVCSGFVSAYSNQAEVVIPKLVPPNKPTTNYVYVSTNVHAMYLYWTLAQETPCPPISGFNVYNKNGDTYSLLSLSPVPYNNSTIYNFNLTNNFGLIPGNSYDFVVQSISTSGNNVSTYSETARLDVPLPQAPYIGLITDFYPDTSIDVQIMDWTLFPSIDSSDIYQDGNFIKSIYSQVGSSTTIPGLIPNNHYTFQAKSISLEIESAFSNTASVTIPLPQVPVIDEFTYIDNKLYLNWTYNQTFKTPPISGFNIYSDIFTTVQYVVYDSTKSVYGFMIQNNLEIGKSYTFRLTSVSTNGSVESYSVSKTFTVTLEIPNNVTLTNISSTNATLNWAISPKPYPSIQSFNIYFNGSVIKNIQYYDGTTYYTENFNLIRGLNEFYITSVNGIFQSKDSEKKSVVIDPIEITYPNYDPVNDLVIDGGYKIYTLKNVGSGSIRFYCTLSTVDITIVGGGGGGGGGFSGSELYAGGGGGSGGAIIATECTIPASTYNIIVGKGGNGGGYNTNGEDGGYSKFHNLQANSGGGGLLQKGNDSRGVSNEVSVGSTFNGNILVSYTDNYNGYGGTGCNVGGGIKATKGYDNYMTQYPKKTPISQISVNYGGGGGGGGGGGYGAGGFAGSNGYGGNVGTSTSQPNGVSATTPGSGGGGATFQNKEHSGIGGAGAPGILIIKVPN